MVEYIGILFIVIYVGTAVIGWVITYSGIMDPILSRQSA